MLSASPGFPSLRSDDARPRCSRSSSVLACTPTAREVVSGLSFLSISRTGILNLESSMAAIIPVGPAPAIKTGLKSSRIFCPPACDLCQVNRFITLDNRRMLHPNFIEVLGPFVQSRLVLHHERDWVITNHCRWLHPRLHAERLSMRVRVTSNVQRAVCAIPGCSAE